MSMLLYRSFSQKQLFHELNIDFNIKQITLSASIYATRHVLHDIIYGPYKLWVSLFNRIIDVCCLLGCWAMLLQWLNINNGAQCVWLEDLVHIVGCTYKYTFRIYIYRNIMRMTRAAFVNLFCFVAAMFWSQYIIRTNVQQCISAYWQLKGAFPDSDSYTNIIVSHSTSICCCTRICLDLLVLFLCYMWI